MRPFSKMGLHSHILPAASRIVSRNDWWGTRSVAESWLNSHIFDCTRLPLDFVIDTGEASYQEVFERQESIHLPYKHMYMEFAGQIAVSADFGANFHIGDSSEMSADEARQRSAELTELLDAGRPPNCPISHKVIELFAFPPWSGVAPQDYRLDDCIVQTVDSSATTVPDLPLGRYCVVEDTDEYAMEFKADGEFTFEIVPEFECEPPPYFSNRHVGDDAYDRTERAKYLLLGVLALLKDQLVLEAVMPDPVPKLNAKRLKQGRIPVSDDVHVLRVNVPKIRLVTNRTALGTHESPALHWRRGHKRVLHRFSEFEKEVWVKRCLVGDPDKGFVQKQYRLVHELPLLGVAK